MLPIDGDDNVIPAPGDDTMPEIALPPTVAGRLRGFYGRRDMPGL